MEIASGTVAHDAVEMDALIGDYYARTVACENMPPRDFNWEAYRLLEEGGVCTVLTARDDERLLGFALYIVERHLHHRGHLVAQCTALGVRPECRGKGIGRGLVEHAERTFKERGVTHMIHYYRTVYNTVPLFERMGFRLEAIEYMKEL